MFILFLQVDVETGPTAAFVSLQPPAPPAITTRLALIFWRFSLSLSLLRFVPLRWGEVLVTESGHRDAALHYFHAVHHLSR